MPPARVDVLILGGGLAGLRAALSCLNAAPKLRVAVVSLASVPSGSSFANRNDALGVHVCLNDSERERYVREVLALNRGQAFLDPRLLAIQAEEGGVRLADLIELGLPFERDEQGALIPRSSCFSPDSRRAYVFKGLGQAWRCFKARLDALGCTFIPGFLPVALRGFPRPGALLLPVGGGASVAVAAKAVIVALGGPARLFRHCMAGPGGYGYSHGLLAESGAEMANCGHLQYMWGTVPGKRFFQSGDWSGADQALAASRRGHCPFGYGLEDSAIDLELAGLLEPDGTVRLDSGRVAPMAHASNGGAVIDEWGQASVPGLLACGECATGMHGANRIGGAMVLATQVFGHRAGVRAARIAQDSDAGRGPALETPLIDRAERTAGLRWLAKGLSRYAVLGGRPGHEAFLMDVRERLETARDWRLRLSLRTGEVVICKTGN
ncbi:MAG: FAD-binding protein [Acidobacteriota bacterium]